MNGQEKKQGVTKSCEQFRNGYSYFTGLGLDKKIKRSILFENGSQWNMDADIDEYTKITLNIIKQIGKTQKNYVMQNEYAYLINSTNFADIRKVQDFLKYEANRLDLKRKDIKALYDNYVKGTGLGYFYWDAEKSGFLRNSGGKLCYQMLDIRRLAVASPYVQNIQDQEWIIYAFPEKISSLKAKYGDKNIVADGYQYTSDTERIPIAFDEEDEYVNVYVKFYKNKQGEVFNVIETETETLQSSTPMNPFFKDKDQQEYPNTTRIMDKKVEVEREKEEKDEREKYIWNLYPFCRLVFNELDNNFYGNPIAYEYIEAQKSINNHYSIYDKALQDNVLGGYIYRKGVLGDQEITTDNGQMIALDLAPSEPVKNAFDRIPVANVPADSAKYSQSLIDITRGIGGASNIQLGMSDYAGQSGKQTQMLLQRAQENSSDNAILFNEFKKDQAYIMFLFAKFYYNNEEFVIVEHGNESDMIRDYTGDKSFNGKKYLADKVVIDIKVGPAPSFSEYANIEILGLMVQSGQLPFEAYINALPEGYISNKQELIRISQNNSQRKIEELEQKMKQQEQVIQQMVGAYEKARKDLSNVDALITENDRLKSMMAEVSANSVRKVAEVNQQNREVTEDMQKVLSKIVKK